MIECEEKGMTARESTKLENIRASVNDLTNSIADAGDQVMAFVEQMDGERPVAKTDPNDAPDRTGRVGAIEDAIDHLSNARDHLFDSIRAFRELNL